MIRARKIDVVIAHSGRAIHMLERAVPAGVPVVACMCYDKGENLDRTMMGVTPEQAVKGLTDAGAHAIGANCGQGLDGYIKICRRLAAASAGSGRPASATPWRKRRAAWLSARIGRLMARPSQPAAGSTNARTTANDSSACSASSRKGCARRALGAPT